jgi:hypothetical protein
MMVESLDAPYAALVAELRGALVAQRRQIVACKRLKKTARPVGKSPGVLYFYPSVFNGTVGSGLLFEFPSGREGGFGGGPNTPVGYDLTGRPIYK